MSVNSPEAKAAFLEMAAKWEAEAARLSRAESCSTPLCASPKAPPR
jgi:hypothetical protein